MKMKLVCSAICLTLVGCATPMIPQATGGSRADGVIEFSYQFNAMQKPVIDWKIVDAAAKERCAAWGYTNAEAFGGGVQSCAMGDAFGCNVMQVTTSYQCTGGAVAGQ
jgi:hypothetical protein